MASGAGIMTGDRKIRFAEFREKNLKIIRYLATGTYVKGLTESQKRVLRCQAKNHMYDEESGALYYKGNKSDVARKVIMEEKDALDVLKDFHASEMGGHCGMNATLAKISQAYYWHGMKQDVVDFVKSCNECQPCEQVTMPPPKIKTFTATEPQELVVMDLMGPRPTTQKGYTYVLIFVDFYTKFVDFFPLKSKDASRVASSIKTFLYRWGVPHRLVTPKSKEFVKEINAELYKKFGTNCSVSSYKNVQTSGLVERFKQTLNVRLSKLSGNNESDWAIYLEGVAYSMRTQKQVTTQYTPFFLMFGRHPRSVLEPVNLVVIWYKAFSDGVALNRWCSVIHEGILDFLVSSERGHSDKMDDSCHFPYWMECTDDRMSLQVSDKASIEEIHEAVSRREELMAETRAKVEQNVDARRAKHRAQRRQSKRYKPFNRDNAAVNCSRKNPGREAKKVEKLQQN